MEVRKVRKVRKVKLCFLSLTLPPLPPFPPLPYVPYFPYFLMIELQRKLLGDKVRNEAFYRALKQSVQSGKTTIVDVGSGTGFLSFLASRMGAKHCTLIDYGDISGVSRKLAMSNGIKNCTFINKHSMDVTKAGPADMMVAEILGNYALEENIIEIIEDAKRFLKPGGIIIPGRIEQFVAPVISDRLQKEIDVMADVGYDLDMKEAREIALNNIYVKKIRPEEIISAKKWDEIDFKKKNSSVRKASVTWESDGRDAPAGRLYNVYGFALWWNAELVPGINLSTGPHDPPTHWEQIYLPLLEPVPIKPGQKLRLKLVSDTRLKVKINLSWEVKLMENKKIVSSQKLDMKRGFLV